ncbi:MAG: hypothetical protein LBH07_03280 [Treponema sp.]|nr:hypothetical protein [Treponema sp.]
MKKKVMCILVVLMLVGLTSLSAQMTVTITGIPGSEYNGWEAYIILAATGSSREVKAWAMPVNVSARSSSLTFKMLDFVTDKPFNTSGTYDLIFYFRKDRDKSTDKNFIMSDRRVNAGSNSIAFSAFPGNSGSSSVTLNKAYAGDGKGAEGNYITFTSNTAYSLIVYYPPGSAGTCAISNNVITIRSGGARAFSPFKIINSTTLEDCDGNVWKISE